MGMICCHNRLLLLWLRFSTTEIDAWYALRFPAGTFFINHAFLLSSFFLSSSSSSPPRGMGNSGSCSSNPNQVSPAEEASLEPARAISPAELAEHNSPGSAWVAVNGDVFDITAFFPRHPGGSKILNAYLGKDATKAFNSSHRWVKPRRYVRFVGRLT